ncbi:MAG: GNAT family N-acetyltransferase [Spirochaetes bacterium]|nr:GNAT family N-acetyltransferase [Spirochaetota bacterium]
MVLAMANRSENSDIYQPLRLLRFGIELRRMVESDKEIVRHGRNQDFVRKNHVYREIITEEEQDKWFDEMNRKEHYVFIVIHDGKRIGVVYLRDIPENRASSTCGLFFWDDDYIATRIPVFAALLALDFASYYCEVQRIDSIVLKNNTAGIKMYTFFGFELREKDADSYLITIDRDTYLQKRDGLINFIKRAVKNKAEHELRVSGSQGPLNYDIVNTFLENSATAKI